MAGLPQIVVDYNRDRLAQYGLHIEDLNTLISTSLAGASAGVFYQGEKRFDIVIRLKKAFRGDIESIRNLYVPLPSGSKVPLGQVANVHFEEGPNQIIISAMAVSSRTWNGRQKGCPSWSLWRWP